MIQNILICTTQVPFTTGGAEFHVEGLCRALTDAGYNVEVVRLPFKWYPPEEIMRGALAWRLLDLTEANGKRIDLVIGMKFPAYLVAHQNKVLWVMHQYRSAYNLWGTQFDDLSVHPEGVRIREWIHQCDSRLIPEARKVFANSKTVAERLRLYNQIESEPLYHPPPLAKLLNCGPQGDYFFYPSRLEPQKRQELLLEALQFVRTPVKVVMAGSTNNSPHYESLIRQYGVGDQVEMLGYVSEPELVALYENSLGVCYLPFDEDYGYVTLEGMLSGKPVIVTSDGGGATEFVEHGREGLVAEPDPRSLADCLDSIYADRNGARSMGERGRSKILALKLSWQQVVETIVSAAL